MPANPKLIVLSEPLRGQSFELVQESYTIGRSEEAKICIPDPTISGTHCVLKREEAGNYVLADMKSTNGTRVNGMRVQSQRLSNSDILQLGGVELLYDSQEKSSTAVLSTQTGINLAVSSGRTSVSDMSNFSPFGSRSGFAPQGSKWVRLGFKFLVLFLVLALAVTIIWVVMKALS